MERLTAILYVPKNTHHREMSAVRYVRKKKGLLYLINDFQSNMALRVTCAAYLPFYLYKYDCHFPCGNHRNKNTCNICSNCNIYDCIRHYYICTRFYL